MELNGKRCLKGFVLTGLALALAICAAVPASAVVPVKELPEVTRWVNGAAVDTNGMYLSDAWAIDNTGIADAKYVLINQNGTEEMRVNKYPDDIAAGKFVYTEAYDISFKLKVPNEVKNEVNLTFESGSAEYTISFNESNAFAQTERFYPGEYNVTNVEVVGIEDEYSLNEAFTLFVTDKTAEVSLEIVKISKNDDEAPEDSVLGTIQAIDSNGDLLWDTIKLFIALGVTFGIYLLIQRKRKKAEEIKH